ncbi:ubiquinone biosynthesis methyltransferase UbiE [Marinovum sp. 2_MG-2023]|uniref:DUF6552 family protein n=1 Tax=Roseobacteraceae TaxID=2854170 RepID=UPI001FD299D9|nr:MULTISPECIES: DUF6552 family protein [Roseobacteraceae]MCJ7873753.1 ubiquinone biosynthesis methyltransferase UbiE [Phaeobacter sp. J2-8]MDO6731028.1 ubiquinone biosynthesis methyltransferase UbiE [Marinovum sp. 2_MG-2023]MDO6778525.1 ubiquinone biosynthesis methyltransferase UbiE [Marinovum sp. 1_MG-2023]
MTSLANPTPPATRFDLVTTVKWIASIIQILGYAATGFGYTPWNLYLFLAGVIGWLAVGILWKDRAIILIHIVAFGSMIVGMTASG